MFKILMGEEEKITQQGAVHVFYHFKLGELVLEAFLWEGDLEATQMLSASL